MMEPWDGPAAIVFSDGDTVGAILDRNGLRPCRWYLTDNQTLILSSEVGVLDILPEKIVKKSRLQPGRMLLADLTLGRLVDDGEIKENYARRRPYGEWLDQHLVQLKDLPIPNRQVETHSQELRDRLYKAFGYTYEEVKDSLLPMNCGVPYCQAGMIYEGKVFGCPLHNLIPEWNDMMVLMPILMA